MRKRKLLLAIGLAVLAGPIASQAPPGGAVFDAREKRVIARLSPLPPPPPDPSNRFADDPRAAAFGKRLFFDRRLSRDGNMSCATCHDPALGFANHEKTVAVDAPFPRNVPSLRNLAYNRWYYWDGRADSSWSQALGPLENELEMNGSRLALLHLVRQDPQLEASYRQIFGPMPEAAEDPSRFPSEAKPLPDQPASPLQQSWAAMTDEDRHAANLFFTNLGKAIAAYERTLLVGESRFDRFAARLKTSEDEAVSELPPAASRGLKLFLGRGECTLCHSGPNLSDGEFHDVGIALGIGQKIDPGRHRGVTTLLRSSFARNGKYADAQEANAPVEFLTPLTHQVGQFKTPTLRGVAETAPYMHDGRFATLEEVVRFYSTRQGARPLGHPTTLLKPLKLSEEEIADLVAFLESLSPLAGGL